MIFFWVIFSLIWHILIIFIFMTFSSVHFLSFMSRTPKISIKDKIINLSNLSKYKKVEVTLGSLPNVAKKDIKYLTQKKEKLNEDNTIFYPKKKEIEKNIKDKLEDKKKEKKDKKPEYLKKLKKIKAITSQKKKKKNKSKKSIENNENIASKNPYLESVKQIIKINWKLPLWLKEKDLNAVIYFEILKSGEISNIAFDKSSKNKEFDKIVLKSIELASPLPAPPISILDKKIFVSFP